METSTPHGRTAMGAVTMFHFGLYYYDTTDHTQIQNRVGCPSHVEYLEGQGPVSGVVEDPIHPDLVHCRFVEFTPMGHDDLPTSERRSCFEPGSGSPPANCRCRANLPESYPRRFADAKFARKASLLSIGTLLKLSGRSPTPKRGLSRDVSALYLPCWVTLSIPWQYLI